MNKLELVAAVRARHPDGLTADQAVEAVLDVIARQVITGGSVGVTGFGVFEPASRGPRVGRNPKTGEVVAVAPRRLVRFRPGTAFADAVETGVQPARPITVRQSPTPR